MKIEADLSYDRVKNYIDVGGAVVPILLVIYGILIQSGNASTAYPIMPFFYWSMTAGWVVLGLVELSTKPKNSIDTALRLIGFHLLASALLFFIVGVDSPFATFWILLTLASYAYFGRVGVIANMIWFSALVLLDFAFDYYGNKDVNYSYFIVLAAMINIGLVIIAIADQQYKRSKELISTKVRENLQRDSVHVIINNLTNAVMSTDKEGDIQFYNAASANLFNTNVSMTGKSIDKVAKIFDSEGKPFHLATKLHKIKQTTVFDDVRIKYSPKDELRIELTVSPIHGSFTKSSGSDAHLGYIILARDVTKSKTLDEEKDEFISVVSHELRTPVATAEGAISNLSLMLDHPDVSNDMKKESAEQAHKEIIFLSKMINDLSTLSRAERGAYSDPELIDVKDLAHALYNEFVEDAHKKKLHFNLDLGHNLGSVYVSRLYLEELLQNFLSNAIKYTLKGTVTLSVKQQSGTIAFSVKDTGVGISKSEQDKIFTKFYRIEDYRTRETTGTGLGLYLTSKLAEKLGTTVKMSSRLNHGSTFSITIPASKSG